MSSTPNGDTPVAIVDAHHHLWDLQRVHYPWLAARGIKRFFGDPAPIQKNYLPEDLRADASPLVIEQSVHIQVGAADAVQHLEETRFAQQMGDQFGLPNAIVAYADLESGDLGATLDAHQEYSSLRGIRQIVGRSPAEDKITGTDGLLNNPLWLEGLREISRRGLSFDLQLIPDQMQRAYEVFSQVEGLPVALCHCGSPWYRDSDGWELWLEGLEKLAQLPNLHCKISGLSMFDHHWTVDSLRPVIEAVLEIFGPERCMFGSNFPVDKLHTDYVRLWQAYFEITASYSASEKKNLYRQNCKHFYNI